MLFRNIEGKLIEINKKDFINDYLFYKKIMELKIPFSKFNKMDKYIPFNYSNRIINKLII